MGGFGFSGEMVFIFFLALILFGPKKMPEIGRQVARFLGEFRRASNEFRSQIESEINALDPAKLLAEFKELAAQRYQQIAADNTQLAGDLTGWLARLNS